MGFRVSTPAPDAGYNRSTDWPVAGGTVASGKTGKGTGMAGLKSVFSSQIGTNTQSQWHPTIAWMMGFVVLELVAFHMLSRYLNL